MIKIIDPKDILELYAPNDVKECAHLMIMDSIPGRLQAKWYRKASRRVIHMLPEDADEYFDKRVSQNRYCEPFISEHRKFLKIIYNE